MHELGQPSFEESDYVAGQYLLIPDIDLHLVVDRADSSPNTPLGRRPKRTPSHGHGYLPQHPRMYPSLVLSGAGIRRGIVMRHTRQLDIAPTVARLLELKLEATSGRVLQEALAER